MTTFEPTDNGAVTVIDTYQSRFGVKALLGGDTYDAKEAIKELDWDETHRSWNDDRKAWEVDYSALNDLEAVLEENGFSFGGVSSDVIDHLVTMDREDATYWRDADVRLTVVYESKRSGREMTKSGLVYGIDPDKKNVLFQRQDNAVMRLTGNGLYSSNPEYPFVGNVISVEVEDLGPTDEISEDEWDEMSWDEKLEVVS